ncbi:hypothetical protein D3C76_1699300 [compost metagenome]
MGILLKFWRDRHARNVAAIWRYVRAVLACLSAAAAILNAITLNKLINPMKQP